MPLVGKAELARVLGRTEMAVHIAVQNGRITPRDDGMFDLVTAIREFQDNTQHEKGHNNRTGSEEPFHGGDGSPSGPASPTVAARSTTYATARASKETYEAQLKRLRYEERAGSLTPTADVEQARFTEFRTLREACFNIPSRIAALLAGESDVARCQQLLEDELYRVFEAFAQGTA